MKQIINSDEVKNIPRKTRFIVPLKMFRINLNGTSWFYVWAFQLPVFKQQHFSNPNLRVGDRSDIPLCRFLFRIFELNLICYRALSNHHFCLDQSKTLVNNYFWSLLQLLLKTTWAADFKTLPSPPLYKSNSYRYRCGESVTNSSEATFRIFNTHNKCNSSRQLLA